MLFHVHQYDILMNHKNKSNYYSLIPQLFHKPPNHSSYYTLINTIITYIINTTLISKYKYNSSSFLIKRERNQKMVQIDLLFIYFSFFFPLFNPLKISKKLTHLNLILSLILSKTTLLYFIFIFLY